MKHYVIDDAGKKKAIIIDLEEFTNLMEYVEEVEDALDLNRDVEQSKEFIGLRDSMQQVGKERRL